MLLSAVSVLVVAQSSSEIPEGLMNNPVLYGSLGSTECHRIHITNFNWSSASRDKNISAHLFALKLGQRFSNGHWNIFVNITPVCRDLVLFVRNILSHMNCYNNAYCNWNSIYSRNEYGVLVNDQILIQMQTYVM